MKALIFVKIDKGEFGPFDGSALECGLRLEGWETTAVSMGPPQAADAMRRLLRLGIDTAALLSDPVFAGSDTLATAYTLSLAARRLEPDLILCGRQSMSGDTAQVGPEIAAILALPLIPYALSLEIRDHAVFCRTREGERIEKLPALVTLERIHTLRLPRALGQKRGSFVVWDAAALGADPARCGLAGSPTRVIETFENQRGRRQCRFVKPEDLPRLIRSAIEEKRVEEKQKFNKGKPLSRKPERKLPLAWVVGHHGLTGIAAGIAEKLRFFERGDPSEIALMAKAERPPVILWPSDWWGRQAAPQAAVMLNTGLCADCTDLETDGETLFFYRPAWGGNLMGKIRCDTRPAMATVRLGSSSGDIILSMGLGMRGFEKEAALCAERIGAEPGASRSAVDAGMAPYETQVGLTGRTVSPLVYLSLGISGALAHTCAIEGAACVIAVNTDRHARIFEYADYGVLAEGREVLSYLQ
jgi:electron transfer flavoprotein alpha subunit